MKGLALAELYYKEVGKPWIEKCFPEYKDRICAGLVGQGSECFGFDDEYSRDHDFGPSFCLWLSEEDYREVGRAMAEGYASLPGEFRGVPRRRVSPHGDGRVGVLETKNFYRGMIWILTGGQRHRHIDHFCALYQKPQQTILNRSKTCKSVQTDRAAFY